MSPSVKIFPPSWFSFTWTPFSGFIFLLSLPPPALIEVSCLHDLLLPPLPNLPSPPALFPTTLHRKHSPQPLWLYACSWTAQSWLLPQGLCACCPLCCHALPPLSTWLALSFLRMSPHRKASLVTPLSHSVSPILFLRSSYHLTYRSFYHPPLL